MAAATEDAVILIAISARPYVAALKQAGYFTVVIDGFLDQETRFFADEAYQLDMDAAGFIEENLLITVDNILAKASKHCRYLGCLLGAGFEAKPQLMQQLASRLPILGNQAQTVANTKSPAHFFSVLSALAIDYPPWTLTKPHAPKQQQWLRKIIGGSGGHHIQFLAADDADMADEASSYYQAYLDGESLSVLFMAMPAGLAETDTLVIGYHQQWASKEGGSFQMGGIVTAQPSEIIQQRLQVIVKRLSASLSLIGLNALDVVLVNERVYVLELNPRLSLSLALYLDDYNHAVQVNLIKLHVQLCLAQFGLAQQLEAQILHAIARIMAYDKRLCSRGDRHALGIVYARAKRFFNMPEAWPDWLLDRPSTAGYLQPAHPVCSVVARAESTAKAKAKVLERIEYVHEHILIIDR